MKRLLAAGAGPIYQLAHAFRDGEVGRRHAPEFTMLEWYRPGFDHHALMDEVEAFVRALLPALGEAPFERKTYRQVFQESAGVDPLTTSLAELGATCDRLGVPVPSGFGDGSIDDALDLLLVCHVEPQHPCGDGLEVWRRAARRADNLVATPGGLPGHCQPDAAIRSGNKNCLGHPTPPLQTGPDL